MPLARANSRWTLAVILGIAAELSTAVVIILVVAVHSIATRGPLVDTTSRFAYLAGAVIGIIGGALFAYLYAQWIGRYLLRAFVAHGLVIAAVAAGIHLVTSLAASPQGYDFLHLSADVLKLLGGAAGGWQASRAV